MGAGSGDRGVGIFIEKRGQSAGADGLARILLQRLAACGRRIMYGCDLLGNLSEDQKSIIGMQN